MRGRINDHIEAFVGHWLVWRALNYVLGDLGVAINHAWIPPHLNHESVTKHDLSQFNTIVNRFELRNGTIRNNGGNHLHDLFLVLKYGDVKIDATEVLQMLLSLEQALMQL